MKTYTLLLLFCCVGIPRFCNAQYQDRIIEPFGNTLNHVFEYTEGGHPVTVAATSKKVVLDRNGESKRIIEILNSVDIVAVTVKMTYGTADFIIIVLSNGNIYRYGIISDAVESLGNGFSGAVKMDGDRLYALAPPHNLYASDDTAKTWFTDTAGISSFTLNDLKGHSLNNVWLATNKGLYFQTEGGAWLPIATSPLTNVSHVFVDKKQRVITTAGNVIYISGDMGLTWDIDTVGLNNRKVLGLGGDKYDNLYAIVSNSSVGPGTAVLKSAGGTGNWVSIATSISNKTYPVDKPIFNSISGDSLLALSTIYGLFVSPDQGVTWTEQNEGITSVNNNAFLETNTGRKLMSTGSGVFYKDKTAVAWVKSFPSYGYIPGGPLYKDNAGNIYTLGEASFVDFLSNTTQYVNYKSMDNGSIWLPDSSGLSGISNRIYYADETGTQHAADITVGTGAIRVFVKLAGGPWQADNTGIDNPGGVTNPTAFYSDHAGNLYIAFENKNIYKRPVSGGTWVLDNNGLTSQAYSFAQTKAGVLLAGTYNGIKQKVSGTWQDVPSPAGLSSAQCFALAVDSFDNIIANYSYFGAGFKSFGHGVFYTSDMGANWHSFNLDTVTFKQLVSVDDTTYGVSYGEGTYAFVATGNVLTSTLTTIKAWQQGTSIKLEWHVVEEMNVEKYTVQHSPNGSQFTDIGTVMPAGKTTYNFLDASPYKDNNYYRIKAIDKNGKIAYSEIVKVNSAGGEINVYPNPLKGKVLNLQINNVPAGDYSLALHNAAGQVIFIKAIAHTGGSATISIVLNNLAKGVYFVQVNGKTQQFIRKILVQ